MLIQNLVAVNINTLSQPGAYLMKPVCLKYVVCRNMQFIIQVGDNSLSLFSSSPEVDFVFEDFARLRLTGVNDNKDEDEPFC